MRASSIPGWGEYLPDGAYNPGSRYIHSLGRSLPTSRPPLVSADAPSVHLTVGAVLGWWLIAQDPCLSSSARADDDRRERRLLPPPVSWRFRGFAAVSPSTTVS